VEHPRVAWLPKVDLLVHPGSQADTPLPGITLPDPPGLPWEFPAAGCVLRTNESSDVVRAEHLRLDYKAFARAKPVCRIPSSWSWLGLRYLCVGISSIWLGFLQLSVFSIGLFLQLTGISVNLTSTSPCRVVRNGLIMADGRDSNIARWP
jgi:hypothetical protein